MYNLGYDKMKNIFEV